MASGVYLKHEDRLTDVNHHDYLFETCKRPIKDEQGNTWGVAGISRDITKRKQTEAAMKEQLALRERLARIAATVPGIIYSFRLRPDGSACIPYASPSIEELCGVRAEDLVEDNSPIFDLIHPDDQAPMRASIAESARTMLPWRAEFRLRHPKKGCFWAEGQSSPEREADGSILWHGFMSDITERKKAQTELESLEREAAEHKFVEEHSRRELKHERELNQIKSQFVSMVSHEFRTPLCVINTAATLLEDYSTRMTGEERTEHTQQIEHAVDRMAQMMEDLLVHEKLECGKMECTPALVDMEAFCRELILEITKQPGAAHLIECAIHPVAREAFLDKRILRHILCNLLTNAVKYSQDHQPVTLEVKRVAGRAQTGSDMNTLPGDHIQLLVRDSGIGIPVTDLAKLFQTFHRAGNVGNRPGTGMGLAIVKKFVDLHRGTIHFESTEGKGTSVWVCLPIDSNEPAGRPSPLALENANMEVTKPGSEN